MTTPDEYRYAKAHLRAAIDHLRLAQHYVDHSQKGDVEGAIISAGVAAAKLSATGAHDGALSESLKPFVPPTAPGT